MPLPPTTDTIAAIATAPGAGAIGIIRVSGPQSLEIAGRLFRPAGRRTAHELTPGSVTYGSFLHEGELIDDGLLLVFLGPRSYTGQDSIELQAHGGPAVLRRLLEACVRLGARQAGPGEFTLRAHLSGRLDLVQAESVLQIIEARSESARRNAAAGLTGRLSERLSEIQTALTGVYGSIQAQLDYPDEGIAPAAVQEPLVKVLSEVDSLLGTARAGRLARHGARLALVGRPNAGKSSLLNALLGFSRSLVSSTPGTTRDYLEAQLELDGIPVTLIDTAGLRESADEVERAGVAASVSVAESADLVLHVVDPAEPEATPEGLRTGVVTVWTKLDLMVEPPAGASGIRVSSVTGEGLESLREEVAERLKADAGGEEFWISNERHAEALSRVRELVAAAAAAPDDLAALDLADALEALAGITGRRDVQGETLAHIFSQFCVGK